MAPVVEGANSAASIQKHKLHEIAAITSSDFDGWTTLISKIEKEYPDDIEKISLIYDTFLLKFPFSHVYWRKYAEHRSRLCSIDDVIDVFERAVQSATYCLDVWLDYCVFSLSAFEDSADVRRLFKRAMYFVGKDYLCHALWDKYIEFEYSQQQWNSLAHIYLETLKFPTKKLHQYFDSFKRLIVFWEEEMAFQNSDAQEGKRISIFSDGIDLNQNDVDSLMQDLQDLSFICSSSIALQAYSSIGVCFYQRSCKLDDIIHPFEACIKTHYFHVQSLDENQLENWHNYLNFVEVQDDFDWAVKLYERCLTSCANYPEFWIRYVEFMEAKGGREIAILALDRATQIFLTNVPVIHLFNSRFKEQIGDKSGACAAFPVAHMDLDSNFVLDITKKANMEMRLGHFASASNIYERAIEMVVEKHKFDILPQLYINFARLVYKITCSGNAATDILIDGIRRIPHCMSLLEVLMEFTFFCGNLKDLHVVQSIIDDAILPSPGGPQMLSDKDREAVASRYLELVDACGTISDITRAWKRHWKLFPHSLRALSLHERRSSMVDIEKALEGISDSPQDLAKHPRSDCAPNLLVVDLNANVKVSEGLQPIHGECSQIKRGKSGEDLQQTSKHLEHSREDRLHNRVLLQSQQTVKRAESEQSPQKICQQSGEDGLHHLASKISYKPADGASHILAEADVGAQGENDTPSANEPLEHSQTVGAYHVECSEIVQKADHPLVSSSRDLEATQATPPSNAAVREDGAHDIGAQTRNDLANCVEHPTVAVSNDHEHWKTPSLKGSNGGHERVLQLEQRQVVQNSMQQQELQNDMNVQTLGGHLSEAKDGKIRVECSEHEAAATQVIPSVVWSAGDGMGQGSHAYVQQQQMFWYQQQCHQQYCLLHEQQPHPNSQPQEQQQNRVPNFLHGQELQATVEVQHSQPQPPQPQLQVQQQQFLALQYQEQLQHLQHQQQLLYQQLLQQQYQQQQLLEQQQYLLQQQPLQFQHQHHYSLLQQWQHHVYYNLQFVQHQQQQQQQWPITQGFVPVHSLSHSTQQQVQHSQQFSGRAQVHPEHARVVEQQCNPSS